MNKNRKQNISTFLRYSIIPLILTGILLLNSNDISAENKNLNKPESNSKTQIYPDEYSELDDKPTSSITKDPALSHTLESSRQQYLQALKKISKGDTLQAAKHFEKAIGILNGLVSYPGIEKNEEFTDLAQSIIDDYESFISSIDELDENTSLFIIRDKLYDEIEKYATNIAPEINQIPVVIDSSALSEFFPPHYKFTIPLDENEYVQKNISFLTTHKIGKKFINNCLSRKSRWFPMFVKMAKEEDIPAEIAFLSMIESGLDPNAVSKANAVGLWQFIRATGKDYGLNASSSVWIDERRDPEKATRAAMRHLRDLYIELGDWHLVMAAYNCGLGCVRRAKQKVNKENPTFWDIFDKLPRETRNYVPQYIATVKVMMNPDAYGFNKDEIKGHEEYVYESIVLNEPLNLSAAAKCAGVSEQAIKDLNPELIRSITPPEFKEYILKLPLGSTSAFRQNLASLTPEEKMPMVNHVVQKGETINRIAEIYNANAREIASFNGLANVKSRLKKGSTLLIPLDPNAPTQLAENQPNETVANPEIKRTPKYEPKNITHTVEKGETLTQISQRYGISISELRNINNIPYTNDNIKVGTELVISKNESQSNNQPEPVITKIEKPAVIKHKVKKGETVAEIAEEYGVSIASILELNKIKKDKIIPGQFLKISSSQGNNKSYASEQSLKLKSHKVKRGENISTIAAKYGVAESDIAKWNPTLVDGSKIFSGTKLKIYSPETHKGSAPAKSAKINKVPKYYKVRSGDTMGEIARKFGISLSSLKAKNKSVNEKKLSIGTKIRLQ